MIKTIFKCDKCGSEWDTGDKECPQMVSIGARVVYGVIKSPYETGNAHVDTLWAAWCQPCVDASHIRKPREKQSAIEIATEPNPTSEDIIISLLEQLGFMREH